MGLTGVPTAKAQVSSLQLNHQEAWVLECLREPIARFEMSGEFYQVAQKGKTAEIVLEALATSIAATAAFRLLPRQILDFSCVTLAVSIAWLGLFQLARHRFQKRGRELQSELSSFHDILDDTIRTALTEQLPLALCQ